MLQPQTRCSLRGMPRRAPLNSNVLAPRMLSYVPLVSVLNTTILEESRTFSRFVSPVAEACTTILKAECPTCTVILVVDWYRRYPLFTDGNTQRNTAELSRVGPTANGCQPSVVPCDGRFPASSLHISVQNYALDGCQVLRYRGCIFCQRLNPTVIA